MEVNDATVAYNKTHMAEDQLIKKSHDDKIPPLHDPFESENTVLFKRQILIEEKQHSDAMNNYAEALESLLKLGKGTGRAKTPYLTSILVACLSS